MQGTSWHKALPFVEATGIRINVNHFQRYRPKPLCSGKIIGRPQQQRPNALATHKRRHRQAFDSQFALARRRVKCTKAYASQQSAQPAELLDES